ncbi:hypothetical protein [Streptosporangium carneum]|uniref:Uncharacterized protein n=1 Tax=Streptosporangium carneum TaxID=47481 RepID=A0A9W6MGG2_9ACTN|nr:hypothetical protein [Streptosporangium carneum]GLK13137.1 hypothetical protein GCM10017600_65480 [Streptosporangium carneum]
MPGNSPQLSAPVQRTVAGASASDVAGVAPSWLEPFRGSAGHFINLVPGAPFAGEGDE